MLCEFVLGSRFSAVSELRHRLNLPAIEQSLFPRFRYPGQMLPRNFSRGQVFHIFRGQAGGFFKFVKSLVEILQICLRFLEFEAMRERPGARPSGLRRDRGKRTHPGIGAERRRMTEGVSAAKLTAADNKTNPAGNHRI